MASGGKKKTTMAKLNRESRLRERRAAKQARKDARKLAPSTESDWLGEAIADPTSAVRIPTQQDDSASATALAPLEIAPADALAAAPPAR